MSMPVSISSEFNNIVRAELSDLTRQEIIADKQFNSILTKKVENLGKANKDTSLVELGNNLSVEDIKQSEAHPQSTNWLVEDEHTAIAKRPNLRDFMNMTKLDFYDANEILYGVIGANSDLRNWAKIIDSENPVDAARAATGQLYNSEKNYEMKKHQSYGTESYSAVVNAHSLTTQNVLRRTQNFANIETSNGTTETLAVTRSGLILRGAGSTQEQIEKTAWLFGFSTQGLFLDL